MKKLSALVLAFAATSAFAGFTVENGPGYKTITFPPSSIYPNGFQHTIKMGTDGPVLAGKVNSTNPAGRPLVIDVESRVVKSALPGFFKKALKMAPYVSTLVNLMDLADELGYAIRNRAEPGDLEVVRLTNEPLIRLGPFTGPASPTCAQWVISQGGTLSSYTNGYCNWLRSDGSVVYNWIATSVGSGASESPSTLEDFLNDVVNHPKANALPDAIEEAGKQTGDPLPFEETPTVSGPSTTEGTTSTTRNSDGTSTTTTTNYSHNYNNNTVNTTVNTTVTTFNNNNVVIDTKTTTSTPDKQEEASPVDTALPPLPKLYERKYPDGLVGVWNSRKAELNSSPLLRLIGGLTPTISTSGGCPQFTIPAKIGPLLFGTGYQGPPCYIWDFCKVVILLSAAFLARALIFGG